MNSLSIENLPPLRQDIIIEAADTSIQGQRQWRVIDPVQNRFFIIGDEDVALLSMWSLGSVTKIKQVLEKINKDLDMEELKSLFVFLKDNYLVEIDTKKTRQEIFSKYINAVKDNKIIYFLTYRFPLVPVAKIQDSIFPYFDFLKSKVMLLIWFFCTAVGIYFAFRQSDYFLHSFKGFISFRGLCLYLLSLVFLKFLHEMGHAHTAHKYGCIPGRLGIATYFGLPMFYIELDSVARLNNYKKKMRISASGIAVEIYIAGWCTFLWAFLPFGIAKDTFFVLATTSWIMSLAVNLNPFAKFDGYYLLCDFIRVENLHQRATYALNRVVEKMALGFSERKAELISMRRHLFMVFFGFGVKIYQIIIVFSIAGLLYVTIQHFLVLILYFAIVYYFLGLGYMKRVAFLFRNIPNMSRTRKLSYLTGFTFFIAIFFLPLNKVVYIPGVVMQENEALSALENSQISSIKVTEGMMVKPGQVLFILKSKELNYAMKQVKKKIDVLQKQLRRIAGSEQDRAAVLILRQELDKYLTDYQGLKLRKEQLNIKATVAGRISDLMADIAVGHYVSEGQVLGLVVSEKVYGFAFLDETQLDRVIAPQDTHFYVDNTAWKNLKVKVTSFDSSATTHIESVELSSEYGGDILVNKNSQGLMVPVTAQHKIRFTPKESLDDIPVSLRGQLALQVEAQSLAHSFWIQMWRIIVTELRR